MGRRITGVEEQLSRLKMGRQIITDNFVNVLNQGLDQKVGVASSEEISNPTAESTEALIMQLQHDSSSITSSSKFSQKKEY